MSTHYDILETRSPDEREKALMHALPQQVAHAKANAPFFAGWLKDVDPAAVTSRAALARLPVLRKALGSACEAGIAPVRGQIGSGALPVDLLESFALAIHGKGLDRLADAFRRLPIPVIGRIAEGTLHVAGTAAPTDELMIGLRLFTRLEIRFYLISNREYEGLRFEARHA